MRRLVPIVLVLASCSVSTKLTAPGRSGGTSSSSSGTSGSTSSSNRQLPMPDLLGKTPEEAEKILRDAGFDLRGFENSGIRYGCDYERNKSYPLFTICSTRPAPGYVTSVHLRAEYEVERRQGNRGDIGLPSEYIFMPDVRGMAIADARASLSAEGLPLDKHFDVVVADPGDGCDHDVVCRTLPGPKMRKALTQRGTIKVGRPKPPAPPVRPPASPPTQPTQPSQPSEEPDTYF